MKLIESDKAKVVLEMSRSDFRLLLGITSSASHDFVDLDQVNLQASREEVDTINGEMFRMLDEINRLEDGA